MGNVNKVLLMGHLTREPQTKSTPSGTAICELGLAVNRRYRSPQGDEREDTCYVEVEAFGRTAEICGQFLHKGSPAFFEGRLRLDQWVDKNTGQNRSRLKVMAEAVQLIGPRNYATPFTPQTGGEENNDYETTQMPPANPYQPPYSQPQPPPPGSCQGQAPYQPPPAPQARPNNYRQAPAGYRQAPAGYRQPGAGQPPQRPFPPPPAFQPPPAPSPAPQETATTKPPAAAAPTASNAGEDTSAMGDNTYEPIPPPSRTPAKPEPPPTPPPNSPNANDDMPF